MLFRPIAFWNELIILLMHILYMLRALPRLQEETSTWVASVLEAICGRKICFLSSE